jgi:hypothetical protein
MDSSPYDDLLRAAARAICAATSITKAGDADVIFDTPDDLTWDMSTSPPTAAPRWRLYEERARAALEAMNFPEIAEIIAAILKTVEKGRSASAPQILEHAFEDIEKLSRLILRKIDV